MKVLFIGPYRQPDHWGLLARAVIKSMRQENVDFCLRPIVYTQSDHNAEFPEEYNLGEFTHIIQHCLPKDFYYSPNAKNIFVHDTETFNHELSNIQQVIDLADETWVTNSNYDLLEKRAKHLALNLSQDNTQALSEVSNQNTQRMQEVLKNNTCFFCNTGSESIRSLCKVKEAFAIAFKGSSRNKLILYGNNVNELTQILATHSIPLIKGEDKNIVLVDPGSGMPEEYLIKNSDYVISTNPFLNVNFTIVKSLQLNTPIITLQHSFGETFSSGREDMLIVNSTYTPCILDINKRGTEDFGNTNEFVVEACMTDLIYKLKYSQRPEVKLSLQQTTFQHIEAITYSNIKELLL